MCFDICHGNFLHCNLCFPFSPIPQSSYRFWSIYPSIYLYILSVFSELQVWKVSKCVKFLTELQFCVNAWDIEQKEYWELTLCNPPTVSFRDRVDKSLLRICNRICRSMHKYDRLRLLIRPSVFSFTDKSDDGSFWDLRGGWLFSGYFSYDFRKVCIFVRIWHSKFFNHTS